MFTADQAEKIRAMYDSGAYTIEYLARKYKRDPSVIRDVLRNTSED